MSEGHPELFFGLVGAIGTDLELIEQSLNNALSSVGYTTVGIRLSDLMRELNPAWSELPPRSDTPTMTVLWMVATSSAWKWGLTLWQL